MFLFSVQAPVSGLPDVSPDEETTTESRSGTSEETLASGGNQSDDESVYKELSDGENGGMKQEVTSTCNIPDDGNVVDENKGVPS